MFFEGLISHLKHDHRMFRDYINETTGDQINTLLAATAYKMKKWMRLILSLVFFTTSQMSLWSQVITNEFVFKHDKLCQVELYNNSDSVISISSILVQSDTILFSQEYTDLFLQPFSLSAVNLIMQSSIDEFYKFDIIVKTLDHVYTTSYNGYLIAGESVGRYPDLYGDFVIYDCTQTSPGVSNFSLGILVKKTSKTKFSPRDSSPNAALYYNSMYWILGGWDYDVDSCAWSSKSNVWRSLDGLDWELVNPNPPFSHYSSFVTFRDKMMVFYGDSVFISNDGVSWDRIRLNASWADGRYIVFRDKLYWFLGDIMGESEDGINWTIHQTNFPCDEILYKPALVTSGNRMWMYGGTEYNSVWYSFDGYFWVKLLNNAPWSIRKWFNYTYFDNKMWVIAGNDGIIDTDPDNFGNLCDFWYSSDGISWSLLETDSSYTNRHASFLWNDGRRLLISSGFGNGDITRMYNDVWELSVDNLFLVTDTANRNLELSIFPDKVAKYPAGRLDSININIYLRDYSFSEEDEKWLGKKISIGNSIDSSKIVFSDSSLYNLGNWEINALSELEFKYYSALRTNPVWNYGSSMALSNVNLSSFSFQIINPYNLRVHNSSLRLSTDVSSVKASFYHSTIITDSKDSTIFRSKWFNVDNLNSSDKLWLTNYDSEKLFVNNIGKTGHIPNLIIRDTNIEFQSDNIQITKILFLKNIFFTDKLSVNSNVHVFLSNNTFTGSIFNNFYEMPEYVELGESSVLIADQDLFAPNLVFYNRGTIHVGINEIKFKGYIAIGKNAFLKMDPEGSFTSGLTEIGKGLGLGISLTFPLDNFKNEAIMVNLSSHHGNSNNDLFKFKILNSDDLSLDYFRDHNIEVHNKSFEVEPLVFSKNEYYKFSLGLINDSFQPISDFNYIFENMADEYYYLGSPVDSIYLFTNNSQFLGKRCYSLYKNPFLKITNHIIFPNPNRGVLNIYDIENFIIEIFDISGRQIFRDIYPDRFLIYQMDFSGILNSLGTYFVVLTDIASGKRETQKVIVVR